MEEMVVLVDEQGNEQGLMAKMEAHEKGVLHRAFSVLIYDADDNMLLQQRALTKYHWAGIWSNACCSHPRQGETAELAAHRRLVEELGFDTDIETLFTFTYRAEDPDSGLIEHEMDTVFTGRFSGQIPFNTHEVADIRWIKKDKLLREIAATPEQYSFWFKRILREMQERGIY